MGLFPKILAAPEVNGGLDACPMGGNCYAFTCEPHHHPVCEWPYFICAVPSYT